MSPCDVKKAVDEAVAKALAKKDAQQASPQPLPPCGDNMFGSPHKYCMEWCNHVEDGKWGCGAAADPEHGIACDCDLGHCSGCGASLPDWPAPEPSPVAA